MRARRSRVAYFIALLVLLGTSPVLLARNSDRNGSPMIPARRLVNAVTVTPPNTPPGGAPTANATSDPEIYPTVSDDFWLATSTPDYANLPPTAVPSPAP